MKTILLLLLIISCMSTNGISQNRFHDWETEKITAIQVEFTSSDDVKECLEFKAHDDINKVISFLKKVDFKALDNDKAVDLNQAKKMSYKISFQGQRDQVYLFKNHAHIGKTTFLIEHGVIVGFQHLVTELVSD